MAFVSASLVQVHAVSLPSGKTVSATISANLDSENNLATQMTVGTVANMPETDIATYLAFIDGLAEIVADVAAIIVYEPA